jgi:choline dehydrogenase
MFDYVVVGAGSAGCVLANRLGKHARVALIEAGPPKHKSFAVRAPGMYQTLWRTPLDWAFSTEPQAHVDNRRMFWPRGKVVGGTSCLNAMVYIRGHRDNYDDWARAGCTGWGYADVLPYFKRSEDNVRGASEYHGAGGELAVGDPLAVSPIARAFVEAAATACKVSVTDDFNAAEQAGAGIYQHTIRRGLRADTASAFLDPVRGRVTIIANALACRVVVDGDRATGVVVRRGGGEETIAAREVILAGGAIGSPHLLLLSGIGPADELRAAGVEARHALAGVGKHLEDHLLVGLVHDVVAGAAPTLSRLAIARWMLAHVVGKRGQLATSPVESGGFFRSTPAAPRPDLQLIQVPFGATPPNTDEPRDPPYGRGALLLVGLLYPKSHGEVRLRSADPTAAPAIDPRYFSDPADLELMVGGVEKLREIAAAAPLAQLLAGERRPGREARSRDELRAAIRGAVNTIFHPVGTCRMGTGDDAVVDPELRVRGLRGLRVADASIMPAIIGGNTNAPVIMIAEKAADLVLSSR